MFYYPTENKICWFFACLPSFSKGRQCCFMQSIRKQTKWLTRILSSSKFGFYTAIYIVIWSIRRIFLVLWRGLQKGRGWSEAIASHNFEKWKSVNYPHFTQSLKSINDNLAPLWSNFTAMHFVIWPANKWFNNKNKNKNNLKNYKAQIQQEISVPGHKPSHSPKTAMQVELHWIEFLSRRDTVPYPAWNMFCSFPYQRTEEII